MSLLSVLQYPDARLRQKAHPVREIDATTRREIDDMFETMYEQNGVGLAATQVAIPKRIIVIDISNEQNSPLCLINPEIIHAEGEQYEHEGCLSFPGVYDKVKRAGLIRVHALNQEEKSIEINAEGLLAVCIQHELDHLNGILFIDHLSQLKQSRLKTKLVKIRRQTL